MTTIDAKNKTTTELAIWLEGLSTGDTVYYTEYPNFDEAAKRLRAQEARIAALTKDAEPLSTNFIQTVPDKCDRIVWRGDYFHLPPKISHINFPTNSMEQEFANYERRGYEKGLAAANTNPPAPKAIAASDVTDEMATYTDLPFEKYIEEKYPNWRGIDDTLARKEAIAFAVNVFNGVKP